MTNKGQLVLVNRLINKRLGDISLALQTKINNLPVKKLQDLGEAVLDFQNLNDLESWLASSGSEIMEN